MLIDAMNFVTERARGLVITVTSAATSTAAGKVAETVSSAATLNPYAKAAYIATTVVGIFTAISYIYKFYVFCKSKMNKKEKPQ